MSFRLIDAMDPFEVKSVLNSMEILVDTREQETDRSRRRYEAFGVPYSRATLSYGDYTCNVTLPSGKLLYDVSGTIEPLCVIERKMNLDELAGCFTRDRKRFERELNRALIQGVAFYLLCENASWENLINGKYRSRMNSKAFQASITAFMVRYRMIPIFCKEETSGGIIKEILYRDIKERIERGDFDDR